MSELPALGQSNATQWLSGDHLGLPGIEPPKEVSCAQSCPSVSHIQSSKFPERLELKMIFLPSGEYWASPSYRVEAISLVGKLFLSNKFGPATRQIFASVRARA